MITEVTGRAMKCRGSIEAMSARLDGEATSEETAALDAHLAECAGCRERLVALERQHRRFRLQEAPVVPDLVSGVLTATPARARRRWFPLVAAAAFAMASLVLFGATLSWGERPAGAQAVVATAVVRVTPSGDSAVVDLVMVNEGGADTVIAGWSPLADHVMFHKALGRVGEAVMQPVSSVAVPARTTGAFIATDTHVMLVGLRYPLHPGEQVSLRLEFARSGPVFLTATVVA